jgi:DNA-binding winged helix-turn-helix (wHTH) protein
VPYRFGPFRLDPQREELWRGDSLVPLNRKAVRLLLALVERHGEIVSKDELLAAVWPQRRATANNLTQHVFMVRSALGEGSGAQRYLLTVPGVGYRFVAPLERGETDSAQRIIARHFCEVAREFCLRRTPASIERSIELYTRAVQYDARCTDALSGLALCRFLLAEYLFEAPREALSLAEQEALRTLEVDRGNPVALVVLARAAAQLRYHWSEAETLLLDAFRSRPEYLWAHVHLVEHYIARARLPQAKQALAHAYSLNLADDPFPRLPLLQGVLPYFEGDFAGAQTHLSALVTERPSYGLAHLYLAKTLLAQDRCDEGIEQAQQAARIEVDPLSPGQPDVRRRALALCVFAHAMRGDITAVREAAARLDAFTMDLPQSSMCAAIVALAYGRRDRALRAMESAVANRESYCAFAASDPLLAPLRALGGWRAIAQAMNLAS